MAMDMNTAWENVSNAFQYAELRRKERNKDVTITFHETGETFTVKKRVAIPLLEALRIYKKMEESPENISSDSSMTARMLLILSEMNY